MIALSTLSVFLLAVMVLFLSPGPNMAFVLSHGVAHGPRGGFAAGLGIAAADLLHTVSAATGLTAVVAAWPPSFDLIRYAGVVYLLWLAVQAIRSPGKAVLTEGRQKSLGRVFRAAMLNCLLNPKALLFFMVFLPQFVDRARGGVLGQIVVLGVVLSAAGLLFNTVLGAFAGRIGRFLHGNPRAARWQGWFLGGVLASLAIRLLVLTRPALR